MEFRIENIDEKILIGMNKEMSYIDNKTAELWQSFMPRRSMIANRLDTNYYSLQVYSEVFDYSAFNPGMCFRKWALVEVSTADDIPEAMERYILKGGLYAVFNHIGPASAFAKSMDFIFGHWMPKSGYKVDDRAHFEVLEEGYNPMGEKAEEEIWIPIKKL